MSKHLLVVSLFCCLSLPALADSPDWWKKARPDFESQLAVGWIDHSPAGGLVDDTTHGRLFLAFDVRPRKHTRLGIVDFDLGVELRELRQTDPSGFGIRERVFRGSVDGDIFAGKAIKRITAGLLAERISTSVEDLDLGDGVHLTPTLMFTWREEGHCTVSNAIVYLDLADFDDARNAGDPQLDRSGEFGDYRTLGVEATFFLGGYDYERDGPLDCERTGPFRRYIPYRYPTFVFGADLRRDETRGTDFDARYRGLYLEGSVPLPKAKRWMLDLRGTLRRGEFPRIDTHDTVVGAAIDFRWTPRSRWRAYVRQFDVRFGLAWESLRTAGGGLDDDRVSIFVGLDTRLSTALAGLITRGNGRVNRRGRSGSSSSEVQTAPKP